MAQRPRELPGYPGKDPVLTRMLNDWRAILNPFLRALGGLTVPAAGGFSPLAAPTGVIDGANVTFALPAVPALLILFQNGVVTTAFTLTGLTITMTTAPIVGDTLLALAAY